MKKDLGVFDRFEILKAADLDDEAFLLECGILKVYSGSYDIYLDQNSHERYELFRCAEYTKGIRFLKDKYDREVKKFYINGLRSRQAQYENIAYRCLCRKR